MSKTLEVLLEATGRTMAEIRPGQVCSKCRDDRICEECPFQPTHQVYSQFQTLRVTPTLRSTINHITSPRQRKGSIL